MKAIVLDENELRLLEDKLNLINSKLEQVLNAKPERIYTDDEFCELLKISKRQSAHYREKRMITYSQEGRKIFYLHTEVLAFMERIKIDAKK